MPETPPPATTNPTIEVCRRICKAAKGREMYHACIKDRRGYWGAGSSVYAAIGNLVWSHPEMFDLDIVYLNDVNR